jgi:type I restriction enzyme S subunit
MALKNKEDVLTIEDKLKAALVPEDEKPYQIPEKWVWTRLGAISSVVGGGTPRSNDAVFYENGDIPWIRPVDLSDYNDMYISYGSRSITREGLKSSSARLIPKNSLLFSSRAPIGYVAIAANDVTTSQGFKSFLPTSALVPQFGYWYLKYAKPIAESLASGTTFQEISGSKAALIPIPLPPIPEQQQIAEKLESLLGKINEAKVLLDEVPEILRNLRQTVLASACSGRLTEEWRTGRSFPKDAKDIVTEIKNRRLKIAESPIQKNKLKDLYSFQEEQISLSLPRTWSIVALNKLCESFSYGTSSKSIPSGEVAVLRMGNIQKGKLDWTDLAYTSDHEEIHKYRLSAGDVLFNRTNSPELVGKTAIYRGEQPAIFAGYLIKINNYRELNSEYLNYCLNTAYAKEYYMRVKSDGVNQSNINAQKLGKFEIPFCPVEEQEEIVRRVESLFSKVDDLEEQYKEAMERIEILPEIILSKAFRGELVPQDPNDEPASVLLERIIGHFSDVSTHTKRSHQGPAIPRKELNQQKGYTMSKRRQDADVKGKPFLTDKLRDLGGKASAEQLYEASDLPIVDFYKQLSDEYDQTWLKKTEDMVEVA